MIAAVSDGSLGRAVTNCLITEPWSDGAATSAILPHFSADKVSPLTRRRIAVVRAGTCGHHANHAAECATRSQNPRTLRLAGVVGYPMRTLPTTGSLKTA